MPPLPIAHAITLRTSPPQGHPNTTLLGFRVALSRRAGSWPFFLPSRVPIDCIAACPSLAPKCAKQTKRQTQAKPTSSKRKARPQRRRLSKGLRPSRRKKGGVKRNAHGSGHLGFANGAWPPDRSAATKIYGTVRWWRPRPGRLQKPFGQPGR